MLPKIFFLLFHTISKFLIRELVEQLEKKQTIDMLSFYICLKVYEFKSLRVKYLNSFNLYIYFLYSNSKTSFIEKTPFFPTNHSAAIIEPKANPSRLCAVCLISIVSTSDV